MILLCAIHFNLPILRSVKWFLLTIVFQKFALTEIMVMQGAILRAEVKKITKTGDPILQKSSSADHV